MSADCKVDVQDIVRLSAQFEVDGVLTNPTTVTLRITTPAGTTSSLTPIVNDSPGKYHFDYTVTVAGHHRYRWTSTGAAAAGEEGAFLVRRRRVT